MELFRYGHSSSCTCDCSIGTCVLSLSMRCEVSRMRLLPQGDTLAAIALIQYGALYIAALRPCCFADCDMILAVECELDCSISTRTGVTHRAEPFLPNWVLCTNQWPRSEEWKKQKERGRRRREGGRERQMKGGGKAGRRGPSIEKEVVQKKLGLLSESIFQISGCLCLCNALLSRYNHEEVWAHRQLTPLR